MPNRRRTLAVVLATLVAVVAVVVGATAATGGGPTEPTSQRPVSPVDRTRPRQRPGLMRSAPPPPQAACSPRCRRHRTPPVTRRWPANPARWSRRASTFGSSRSRWPHRPPSRSTASPRGGVGLPGDDQRRPVRRAGHAGDHLHRRSAARRRRGVRRPRSLVLFTYDDAVRHRRRNDRAVVRPSRRCADRLVVDARGGPVSARRTAAASRSAVSSRRLVAFGLGRRHGRCRRRAHPRRPHRPSQPSAPLCCPTLATADQTRSR